MAYRVHYKTSVERSCIWAPKGEREECDEQTALRRFRDLLARKTIAGERVMMVFIVDADVRAPSSEMGTGMVYGEACEHVTISQYVGDDYAMGPWSGKVAA